MKNIVLLTVMLFSLVSTQAQPHYDKMTAYDKAGEFILEWENGGFDVKPYDSGFSIITYFGTNNYDWVLALQAEQNVMLDKTYNLFGVVKNKYDQFIEVYIGQNNLLMYNLTHKEYEYYAR